MTAYSGDLQEDEGIRRLHSVLIKQSSYLVFRDIERGTEICNILIDCPPGSHIEIYQEIIEVSVTGCRIKLRVDSEFVSLGGNSSQYADQQGEYQDFSHQ